MSSQFKTIQYQLNEQGIAILLMDIPGSNANVMGDAFRDELDLAVNLIASDDNIKGAVIGSVKNDFMAGGDLNAMVEMFANVTDPQAALDIANSIKPTLRKLECCSKPIVAAINGPAMGGGLELALACHGRVVSDSAKVIMGLPEVTLGLMPGAGGSQRLPRMIGIQKALEIMLQGRPFNAAKALELGIVDAIVAPEKLIEAACQQITDGLDPIKPWDKKGYTIPGGSGFFDADLGNLYNYLTSTICRDTQRNTPAPLALLTAVARGTAVPFDAGLHIESCYFAKLILDPTARNMVRTLFVSKGELDKLSRRPKGIDKASFQTIGVIGSGLMGGGIAQSAAKAGIDVVLLDISDEQASKGKDAIAKSFGKLIAKGRMQQEKADALLAKITPSADYSKLASCQLVVEAVFEDVALKQMVFKMAREHMPADAILASNTSSLPISQIGEGLPSPDRFLGLHFFSPVERMPLIEVIRGKFTSDKTLAEALDFVALLRKTPIIVNDSRGFFTSRVISAYLQEAFAMVAEGISPTLIDNIAKQAGFAIGPLALIDDIGLENGYKASLAEKQALGERWVEPAGFKVQKQFNELGRIGRRGGMGFYDYSEGVRAPSAAVAKLYPASASAVDAEQIKQRLLYVQALEAARCYEEGVITDAAEADVGVILGIGFPSYTGGVFSLIDTLNCGEFVAALDALTETVGERFRASDWLRSRAEVGIQFYA
ncbi:MAG: 3-hydroxyacyl-CoA dehydrogenase NAD-binding domain-containing protein [Zhongshania sp.]|uniref:3-hydroxyacyl-CoA dehydrogenase NAD-binding domain-containing protein n=1 Tax=Zhongshania sp. TaxID=1971902 RepID=UPI0026090228|nr:3-hydroxyacyl-CoA dehydrogenase NAD-binding domain-containing protein [Zhongshania sp.]MDF1691399.1 3-hydroxyacyl-CoA dehydrogenase NAD-binding domain-containing protein [Zhongshania sp.]